MEVPMKKSEVLSCGTLAFRADIRNATAASASQEAEEKQKRAELIVTITFTPNADYPNTTSILFEQLHTVLSPDPADTTLYDADYTQLGHLCQQTTGEAGGFRGYVVDHSPSEMALKPKEEPKRSQNRYNERTLHYYMYAGADLSENKEGSVQNGKISPAVLYDTPGDTRPQTYRFLTAVYDRTCQCYLGQVTWGFQIMMQDGKASIKDADVQVTIAETTDRYRATADEARKHFYNYWGYQKRVVVNGNLTQAYVNTLRKAIEKRDEFYGWVMETPDAGKNTYPSTPYLRWDWIKTHQRLSAAWTDQINKNHKIDTTTTEQDLTDRVARIQNVYTKYQKLRAALKDEADKEQQEHMQSLLETADSADTYDALQKAEENILAYTLKASA